MALTEQQTPQEFLVRWNDAGQLQGAHIVHRIAYLDGATVVFSKFSDPQAVDLNASPLLAQISADINAAALADGTAKAVQLADLTSQLTAAQQAHADAVDAKQQAESARDAALAQVQDLQAQLAQYQNPPPETNWIPRAQADLGVWKVKVNGILSQMVTVYTNKGQAANASAVVAAMEAVAIIQTSDPVVAALTAVPGSRAAFDAAVQLRWLQIVGPTPAQVKADFPNYAAGTL